MSNATSNTVATNTTKYIYIYLMKWLKKKKKL